MRAQRLAQVGGFALAIALTPVLAATALAADPTVVVQPGDTLTAIARRHRVSIARLVELNHLANPSWILAGQRLRVGRDRSDSPRAASASAGRTVHVVTSGSTVWGIARRYGVSMSAIVTANHLADPARIFTGQRLVIPGAPRPERSASRTSHERHSDARPPARVVHVVTSGSTVWGIARRYGVSTSAIVAANHLADPSRIFTGQRLVIPGARATSERAARRASMPATMAGVVAERASIRRMIARASERYGVPRGLALAVAWQESGWQQGVVSYAGAVGVMQLMPATAAWIGETMLGRHVRIDDARSNVAAGVRLLRHYLDRYDGDREMVLAAYYQGQHAADHHGIYSISRPYIASILHLERIFSR